MTESAKKKADELIEKFGIYFLGHERQTAKHRAKRCAIICVEEILKAGQQEIVVKYFDDIFWNDVLTILKEM